MTFQSELPSRPQRDSRHQVSRKKLNASCWLLFLAIMTPIRPAFADPCGAVMCLAQNKSAPQQCKGHVDEYFNIRVYRKRHIFDPGATAGKRYNEVLNHCSEARQEDKDFVSAQYGMLEHYPFDYVNE